MMLELELLIKVNNQFQEIQRRTILEMEKRLFQEEKILKEVQNEEIELYQKMVKLALLK